MAARPHSSASFDSQRRPAATADFKFPNEQAEDDDERRLRLETLTRFLQFLTSDAANISQIGARAVLLAFVLRLDTAPRSQAALAKMLGLSPGRVSQRLKVLRRDLAQVVD